LEEVELSFSEGGSGTEAPGLAAARFNVNYSHLASLCASGHFAQGLRVWNRSGQWQALPSSAIRGFEPGGWPRTIQRK
jgi:hypothetical protein